MTPRPTPPADVVIAVNVPSDESGDGIGSGKKTVSVTATGSGRVAEGSIEIPKAAIALDPESSRRGTTVNVSGSGFPSGDLVQVKYDNDGTLRPPLLPAPPTPRARSALTLPCPATQGSGQSTTSRPPRLGCSRALLPRLPTKTPGAMVTLSSDTISSGENITITGMNFPAFATVAVMEIGGVDVTGRSGPCHLY